MTEKKKILVIQKVHDKGMELIKNHPAFQPTFYHGSLLTEQYPHLNKKN